MFPKLSNKVWTFIDELYAEAAKMPDDFFTNESEAVIATFDVVASTFDWQPNI